jgi:hypothetical protein
MRRIHWGPDQLDRLERAIDDAQRIRITRRGTEYVILPRALRSEGPTEVIVAVHPNTGEEMRFRLDEIEEFSVIA